MLPFADPACITAIEENMKTMPPVSSLIDQGTTPEEICRLLLRGLDPDLLDESSPAYHCDCSRSRVERTLSSLNLQELAEMRDEDHGCEVCCHFCETRYTFTQGELEHIIARKQSQG